MTWERIERPGWFHSDEPGGGRLAWWMTDRIRATWGHEWLFGVTVRVVTFADRRSGSSGLMVNIGCGPWRWQVFPWTWANRPVQSVRVVSLAEKLGVRVKVENVDEGDDEE